MATLGKCMRGRIPTAWAWFWSGSTAPLSPLQKRLVMVPSVLWVSLPPILSVLQSLPATCLGYSSVENKICPVHSQLVHDLAVVAGAALSLAASLCHLFSLPSQAHLAISCTLSPCACVTASQCMLCPLGQSEEGFFGATFYELSTHHNFKEFFS